MKAPKLLFCLAAMAAAQPMETVRVAPGSAERKMKLPAELQPYLKVSLQARVTGFVEAVEVDRGSLVKAGQILIRLSAPELAAQIAEAEAKVMAAESQKAEAEARLAAVRSTFERLKAASETPGAVSANELMVAEKSADSIAALVRSLDTSAAAARSAVKPLRELESYLRVTAPFDGVITARSVHPGALAGPAAGAVSGALLELEQVSRLRLVVALPEADVPTIQRGAAVRFRVPAHPGQEFTGVVARIPSSLDPKTRTMPVELDVNNSRGSLAPGMYAEVDWPSRRTAGLLVPPTAIVTTTERSFVVRVKDGRAEWVNVSKGAPAGDLVEVFGALAAGDDVVKRATDEIRNGSALSVKK